MEQLAVFQAINAVQAALVKEGIAKNRKNQQQGYNFRGIDDIYNALSELLASNKLCILPEVLERVQVERTTNKGGVIFYTTVKVKYTLVSGVDGSKFETATYGEAMDSADKATNKAMSAAYKYLCLQVFCIPTEGDNDADGSTPEQLKPQVPKPAQPAPTIADRVAKFKQYIAGASLEELNSAKYKDKFDALLSQLNDEGQLELTNMHNSRMIELTKAN